MSVDKIKLKWKIFAFLLGFCVLLLMILWMFQTVFLDEMYKLIRTQELHQAIAAVEKEIDNPDILNIIRRIEEEKDIVITLTRGFDFGRRATVVREGMHLNTITEEKVFTFEDGQRISLTFYAVIMPVNATVTTLREQLYYISAIMLVLAVVLAFIIAKRVSAPIEVLSKSTLDLSKGNYDVRFDGKGFYEIVALSETLNTAAFELGKAEKFRRELLANVSHDLRTPLALVYSYAEMMHDFPDEITTEHIKVIMDETARLSTLVSDALNLSKLESEMEQLNLSEFNLTSTVTEINRRMSELLHGFTIDFAYDEDVYVNADKTKIDRVYYNLLINAVNYSDLKKILVEQTKTKDRVRISVTDSGHGISREELPHIWDRYYKSGKSHKRAVTGSGLGLSIVRKIIEMHRGNYGVSSAPEQGSTFWFELEAK